MEVVVGRHVGQSHEWLGACQEILAHLMSAR